MFTYMHLADTTRLADLGQPLPYILLVIPFLYLLTSTPTDCLFRPFTDLLTSNKSSATAANSATDRRLFVGILTGTLVLLQSNLADTVYLSARLLYSALAHRPL